MGHEEAELRLAALPAVGPVEGETGKHHIDRRRESRLGKIAPLSRHRIRTASKIAAHQTRNSGNGNPAAAI